MARRVESQGAQLTPEETLRVYAQKVETVADLLASQEKAAEVLRQAQERAAEELLAVQQGAATRLKGAQRASLRNVPEKLVEQMESTFEAEARDLRERERRVAELLVQSQREAAALLLEATLTIRDEMLRDAMRVADQD